MNKKKLNELLYKVTGCAIQGMHIEGNDYGGWCCGSCFISISPKLHNSHWQALLYYRGDYKKEDLENLPKDIDKALLEIWYYVGLKVEK